MKEESRIGGPYEFGVCPHQGKRTDILDVKDKLDRGVPMRVIVQENFATMSRIYNFARTYKRIITQPRSWPMQISLYIGPTGTGKSRRAQEEAGPNPYWVMNGKWFEDYDGEEVVIWDEFYGHCCPFSLLLKILDRYPLKLECKGSAIEFVAKKIIFTSNQEPEEWYSGEKTHQMSWAENPLNRRLKEFGTFYRSWPEKTKVVSDEQALAFFPGVVNASGGFRKGKVSVVERLWGPKPDPVPPSEETKALFEKSRTFSDGSGFGPE